MLVASDKSYKIYLIITAILVAVTFSVGFPIEETNAVTKPAKVQIKKISAGESTVKITWKAAKGAKGYDIYKDGKKIKRLKGKNNVTFKNTGLKSNTRYTYKVRAYTTYKKKQWYNKKTGKWQSKKPKKKYRGKSRNKTLYKYGGFSQSRSIRTAKAAAPVTTQEDVVTTDKSLKVKSSPKYINAYSDAKIYFELPTKGSVVCKAETDNVKIKSCSGGVAVIGGTSEAGKVSITATFTPDKGYACTGEKTVKVTMENKVFPCNGDGTYTVIADWVDTHGSYEPTYINGLFVEFSNILAKIPAGSIIYLNKDNMQKDPSIYSKVGWAKNFIIGSSNQNVVKVDSSQGATFVGKGNTEITIDQVNKIVKVTFVVD